MNAGLSRSLRYEFSPKGEAAAVGLPAKEKWDAG